MKKIFQKWFPPFLMFVMALWFFGNLSVPKDKDFAFTEFAKLPITANGRIVPLDSLARNSLLAIREKQTVNKCLRYFQEQMPELPILEGQRNQSARKNMTLAREKQLKSKKQ